MEFFKFPEDALKEWSLLDRNENTTDEEFESWYRKWLTKIQTEVVEDQSEGCLVKILVRQYREAKAKRKAQLESLKKELFSNLDK